MLKKAVILLLLAITGANAVCTCYNSNLVKGTRVALSNAFDDVDFSTCYSGSCGFLAYSGDPAVGWNNINIKFASTADPTGKFEIYNGNTTASAKIATYGVSNSGNDVALYSSTPFIYVVYSQTNASLPNAYYGFIHAGGGLSVPTTPATTTLPPTTIPYSSPLYAKDPQLISHDILVLVNQNYGQTSNGMNALNDVITKFVKLLSVTTTTDSEKQSRLGLATIIPYDPFYSAQGEIWMMNSTDVIGALPQAGVTIAVDIISALKNVVPPFFNVAGPTAATRKNVQRSVILFTSSWNDNAVLNNDVKTVFDSYGVNLAIIGYNAISTQLSGDQWYNYAPLTNTTDADVAGFVNRFYLNSDKINQYANNWCKKSADPTGPGSVTEPSNYLGPPDSEASWTSSFDGQKARYCNFQDTTYTYTRIDATQLVKITVFYELEVEQDYLKFFADGVEVESFTGIDVNNAVFSLDANVTTARFTSDSSGVKRGFYVQFDEVSR